MSLRADAQRNHDRVLDAACECFAERGVEVSCDEIARRAGVGHGTVFRRFPTKDALISAVILRRIRDLTIELEAAPEEPDPGRAFAGFFRRAAEAYARDRALVEGFAANADAPEVAAFMEAVGRLVEHAQDAGALRRDLSAKDVLALVPAGSLYPDVILDGLRVARAA
jgi:AcrR family transcriptional regulator